MSNKSKQQQKNANPNRKQVVARNKRKAQEATDKGEKQVDPAQAAAKKKERRKKIVRDVFVGVACALLILAFGLSSIIQFCGASSQSTSSSASTSAASASASSADYDAMFEQTISTSVGALTDSSESSAYKDIADMYMYWATNVSQGTFTSSTSVTTLIGEANSYYKKCIDSNATKNDLSTDDANAVTVNYALTVYDMGDTSTAITQLEEFTATTTDYPEAWAYLGSFYEQSGESDKAKTAYEQALGVADSASDSTLIESVQSSLDALG